MSELFRGVITGTGSDVPPRVMTNDDLSKLVDTSDEWIATRTGIRQRHVVEPGIASSDIAYNASVRAMEAASCDPAEIDLIVCGTVTPDTLFPSTACLLQKRLGCENAGAFDVSAACTGFIYALSTASQFIASGHSKKILVVGVDTLSTIVDYSDRNTCVLFGDGAGAVVLEASQDPGRGVLYTKLAALGDDSGILHLPGGGSRIPTTVESVQAGHHFLKARGREIYKFAVTRFTELVLDAAEQVGAKPEDIDHIIPHQVNLRIIEAAAQRIGVPMDKYVINIDKYGNTSAGSVPLALDEHVRKGAGIKQGDLVVMVAFGAGLTWASVAMRW